MSCTFTLALPTIAIVGSDTRINNRVGEILQTNDSGDMRIIHKDSVAIALADTDRKIKRYPGGWATGTGVYPIVHACLAALNKSNARTPYTIHPVLQNVFNKVSTELQKELVQGTQLEPTSITYIYNTSQSFKLGIMNFSPTVETPAVQQYYLTTPPELPEVVKEEAVKQIQQIQLVQPSTEDNNFADLITPIAKAFHLIHSSSVTVSDLLDLVIIIKLGNNAIVNFRVYAENMTLINANRSEINQLITPIN
jgi:hypothetical protein